MAPQPPATQRQAQLRRGRVPASAGRQAAERAEQPRERQQLALERARAAARVPGPAAQAEPGRLQAENPHPGPPGKALPEAARAWGPAVEAVAPARPAESAGERVPELEPVVESAAARPPSPGALEVAGKEPEAAPFQNPAAAVGLPFLPGVPGPWDAALAALQTAARTTGRRSACRHRRSVPAGNGSSDRASVPLLPALSDL